MKNNLPANKEKMVGDKIRVFISSVQKELEPERMAIASLISSNPFLSDHLEPVLFDKELVSTPVRSIY